MINGANISKTFPWPISYVIEWIYAKRHNFQIAYHFDDSFWLQMTLELKCKYIFLITDAKLFIAFKYTAVQICNVIKFELEKTS